MSYIRDKTRPQGDRPIFHVQKNFGGGLNVDLPASDINKNELSVSENVIAHDRYMEGRSGSVKINATMPTVSNSLHSVKQHTENGAEIFHWGAKLFNKSIDIHGYNSVVAYGEFPSADEVSITASVVGSAQNAYTVIVSDTVSAGAETIVWSATSVTIACEAGVSTITQILAAAGGVTGTAWGTLADVSGSPGSTTIAAMGSTAMSGLNDVVTGVDDFFTINSASTLKQFGGNFILYTTSGLYMIVIDQGQNKFFKINEQKPLRLLDIITGTGDYRYRYIFTYSIIFDSSGDPSTSDTDPDTNNRYTSNQTLMWEGPIYSPADERFSFYIEKKEPGVINAGNSVSIGYNTIKSDLTNQSLGQITHLSIYRTHDLGVNGLDDLNNNNYVWIADVPVSSTSPYSDVTTEAQLDSRLVGGGYLYDTWGWEPLPSGDVGEITDAFLFTATRGNEYLYYNQLEDIEHIGYYAPAFQYKKFEDQINILAGTPDILTIACESSTHICSLNLWTNPFGEDGVAITFVAALSHFTPIDRTIGVKDYGSFAEVEQGTYIAVCSDKSVRIWEGAGWGDDLSKDKVNDIIKKVVEGVSVGFYYKGAYLLWYTDDITATPANATPTKCIRLSLKKASGRGWTKYTGTDWPLPPPLTGVYVYNNKDSSAYNGDDLLFVVDVTDEERYWIETFDGSTNMKTQDNTSSFPIKKYFGDKMSDAAPTGAGTEIIPKFRGADVTGSRESFNILHSESHIYMRDVTAPVTRATLAIDALAYVDNSSTPTETVGRVSAGNDIQFWRRVEGSRIAIEYEFNRSGIIITGTDTRYRVQDIKRKSKSAVQAVAGTFQNEWASDLLHWVFTRPKALIDRVTGKTFTSNGSSTETSPDSRSKGVKVGDAQNAYVLYDKTAAITNLEKTVGDFTINFWCKDPTYTTGECLVLTLSRNDDNDFKIIFLDTDNIRLRDNVTNHDISITAIDDGEWHNFIIVRSGTTVSVYQNNVDKGTATIATALDYYKAELG